MYKRPERNYIKKFLREGIPQANRTTKTWRSLRFKRKMSVAFQFFFLQCSDLSDFKMFKSIKHNKIIKLYYESHRQHNRQSLWTMTKLINKVTLNNFCSENYLVTKSTFMPNFLFPLLMSLYKRKKISLRKVFFWIKRDLNTISNFVLSF